MVEKRDIMLLIFSEYKGSFNTNITLTCPFPCPQTHLCTIDDINFAYLLPYMYEIAHITHFIVYRLSSAKSGT